MSRALLRPARKSWSANDSVTIVSSDMVFDSWSDELAV